MNGVNVKTKSTNSYVSSVKTLAYEDL